MTYQVEISKRALRQLEALPRDTRVDIAARIDALTHDPRPFGSRKLVNVPDGYRLRVGDYRVIYEIQGERLVVLVLRVGHRREVYRGL